MGSNVLYIAYLDEFGHIGPFVDRKHPQHNTSPVFGLGGLILPAMSIRGFSSWFFQLKCHLLKFEIDRAGQHPATWEKKGSQLYTAHNVATYAELRRATNRLLNKIQAETGNTFFVGIEKTHDVGHHQPKQLYLAVLREALKRLHQYGDDKQADIMVVMDEHPDRSDILTVASQEMYGSAERRRIIEPPFQVESHRYQTCQAADWVCGLVGRLASYRVRATDFSEFAICDKYFGQRLKMASARSSIRSAAQQPGLGQVSHPTHTVSQSATSARADGGFK